jgi:Rps23 Pro-64 3,4-dihydroxylase Tpa1-like proline 4-hydroxylase
MKVSDIISENYCDLELFTSSQKKKYLSADPFPNIELNDFFNQKFLEKVLKEFPDLENLEKTNKYINNNEIKYANNQYDLFPETIKVFLDFLNSPPFLKFIQNITSIKENLVADKELNGGGLHEIKKGGVLKIHTDFNRHPTLDLDRRVNVLIYLNKNWKDEYGGHLELWDREMRECKKKIVPNFNKIVIFSTNDFSNHGHPNPVTCPNNYSRKSIALYYFSKGRPSEEINKYYLKNKTYFKNRAGYSNDTENKNERFKNFLRGFKFYKSMKNFEKKYLRKK